MLLRAGLTKSLFAFALFAGFARFAVAATLEVGTRGELSSTLTNFRYVLLVEGNGISHRSAGSMGGTTPTVAITVPVGNGYRVRIISDNNSTFGFGGQAIGVAVTENAPNLVMVEMKKPLVRQLAGPPVTPLAAAMTMSYEISDASGFFDNATEGWLWGIDNVPGKADPLPVSAGGYMADTRRYSTAMARTSVQKLSDQLYRVTFENVPAPPVPGWVAYRFSVAAPPFSPESSLSTGPLSGTFTADFTADAVQFGPPAEGVTLTVPGLAPDVQLNAVVDGKGFSLRARGSSPLTVGVPSGQGYRLRYFIANTEDRLFSGRTENVGVLAGRFTAISGSVAPWSITPEAGSPTQVSAGQRYTLGFAMTDPGHIFEDPQHLLLGSVKDLQPLRNASGGTLATDVVRTGENTFRVTYAMVAPPVAGTEAFQVVAWPRPWWWNLTTDFAFYSPDRQRGGSGIPIEFSAPQTGVDIVVQGIPSGATLVAVKVEGPANPGARMADSLQGGTATARVGVQPGAGYRVRAVAVQGPLLPSTIVAVGASDDFTVVEGTLRQVSITMIRPTLAVTSSPPSVGPGEQYELGFRLSLPERFLREPLPSINLRSSTSPFNNGVGDRFSPTVQTASGGVITLAYSAKAPSERASAKLTHQLEMPLGDFNNFRVGEFFPSLYLPDFFGTEPSIPVNLVVPQLPPVFASQPMGANLAPGATVVLNAILQGDSSLEWRKDGTRLSSQHEVVTTTSSTALVLKDVQASHSGVYTVIATNNFGSVVSAPAVVTVTPGRALEPARMANLSVRGLAGSGAETLIAGFVVGGAGTTGKPLLVRGAGPSLAPFNVAGYLVDPVLTVFAGDRSVASNDNWGGNSAIKTIAAQLGAFGFVNDASADAALSLPTLLPGAYSAQISSAGGGVGAALVEVYDADRQFSTSTPRLINLSARVYLKEPGEKLIAGFVVRGGTAKTLLIRAVGPGLVQFSVPGTMANPKMELFAETARVAVNDDWGGQTLVAEASAKTGAFPVGAFGRDAAMLTTLNPGNYSVHVSGEQNSTGIVLVEIYEVE